MHHVISWLCYTYERNKLAREFETSTGVDSPCGAVAVMASAVSSEWLHEVLMYCLTLSREQREIGPLCAGRLLEHRFKAHIPRNLPETLQEERGVPRRSGAAYALRHSRAFADNRCRDPLKASI